MRLARREPQTTTLKASATITVSPVGLAASATCALGLVIALVSLIAGHAGVAILALMVAGLAPWLGLAWVSHGRREAGTVTVRFVGH